MDEVGSFIVGDCFFFGVFSFKILYICFNDLIIFVVIVYVVVLFFDNCFLRQVFLN